MIEFILGITFVTLGIPILQSIADMITGLAQWFIAYCSAHISQYNKYIENSESNANAIGFQVPNQEEYECEDDEE